MVNGRAYEERSLFLSESEASMLSTSWKRVVESIRVGKGSGLLHLVCMATWESSIPLC